MIDTQAFRSKILDLAMRGQLTEQLPEDGTAEELYQQIQTEKQERIDVGAIKKETNLPEIDCVFFDLPSNWIWVRWGELSFQIQYGYNAPAKEKGRIKMVRITDIQDNKVIWNTVPFCDIDDDSIEDYLLRPNNILFARTGGTVGKSFLVENVEEDAVFAGYLIRTSFSEKLSAKYMKYFMESRLYWKQLQDGTTATAQPNCNAKTLSKMLVPLPPISEQQRIVEKIEQSFSVLDTIDALQAQYADNLTILKSKLIDAAIQGKLTEQLPEDGTAKELYQQIQAEKQALIKEGKIKKQKPLPDITEDEIPFGIPDNWRWARIGDILTLQSGKNKTAEDIKDTPDDLYHVPCFGGNGQRGFVDCANVEGYHAIIGRQGALCGNVNFAKGPFYATEHAVVAYEYAGTDMNWVGLTLRALNLNQYATSVAQPGLAVNKINRVLIPLPPLAEQKRIVNRLEKLLAVCDGLK